MRNQFSISYGLLVITHDFRVVLIERIVPYCIQNFLVRTKKSKTFIPPFDPIQRKDYNRFLNGQPFEDQWDIPHGQQPRKKKPKRGGLVTAYREFREETGFILKDPNIIYSHTKHIAQIDFIGLDTYEYTQFYFILIGVDAEHLVKKNQKKRSVDGDFLNGHLLTFQEAYEKLLQQQTLKKDKKHLLIQSAFDMAAAVRFSSPTTIHSYEKNPDDDGSVNYTQIAIDRQREEHYPSIFTTTHTHLKTASQIFQIDKDIVIVFGNLGRYPHLLHYYLDICFPYDCHVQVDCSDDLDYKSILSSCYIYDGCSPCDVLICIEPNFGAVIRKYQKVKRMIYLTSHLNLNIPTTTTTIQIVAYQFGLLKPLPPLLDCSSSSSPDVVQMTPPSLGKKGKPLFLDGKKKIIQMNLMKCRTAREAYLRLLQARDEISQYSQESVLGYSICMKNHQLMVIRNNFKSLPKIMDSIITPENQDLKEMIRWYTIM